MRVTADNYLPKYYTSYKPVLNTKFFKNKFPTFEQIKITIYTIVRDDSFLEGAVRNNIKSMIYDLTEHLI